MSGIFGTKALLIVDVNLILMLIILTTLVIGYLMMRRGRLKIHGYLMFIVVVLKMASILLVMLPSGLVILTESHLVNFIPITAVHVVIGSVTEAVGLYIVWTWRFKEPTASCFRLRRFMKWLFILWLATIGLGILLYYLLNI